MTWREGYERRYQEQPARTLRRDGVDIVVLNGDVIDEGKKAFRAGAKWAAGDLIDNAVWESRDIVYEFQKRLEEE